jgi:hypothetical protein
LKDGIDHSLSEGQAIEFELVKLGKVLEWKMLSKGSVSAFLDEI